MCMYLGITNSYLQMQATMLLTVCLLLHFLHTNLTALWILFLMLGFLTGPLIASGFAMVNCYMELTSLAQMVPHIGAAVGDVVIMYLVGYSYENYGPYSIWTHSLWISALVFTVSSGMFILGKVHGDRFETDTATTRK